MTNLCRKFGLDVDGAINQLLDYKNSSAKQVRDCEIKQGLCLIKVLYDRKTFQKNITSKSIKMFQVCGPVFCSLDESAYKTAVNHHLRFPTIRFKVSVLI